MSGTQNNELLALLERFSGTKIGVVGDLILDRYVWGDVERISPEAPVVVVSVTRDSQSLGGAANVANNLVSLGAKVTLAGVRADDDHGRLLQTLLEEKGIDGSGVVTVNDRPTTVKTRVMAAVQQVVRIDRESEAAITPEAETKLGQNVEAMLKHTSGLILSDYSKGVVTAALCEFLGEQAARGTLGLGKIPFVIDPKDRNFALYRGATVIKPNRKEAQIASGMPITNRTQAGHAARVLIERWNAEMVLVTLGSLGMVLEFRDNQQDGFSVDTHAREVFDVSGAGDTVSAVLTLALAVGATPVQAALLANYAAGIVVGSVGAVAVPFERLREVVVRGEI